MIKVSLKNLSIFPELIHLESKGDRFQHWVYLTASSSSKPLYQTLWNGHGDLLPRFFFKKEFVAPAALGAISRQPSAVSPFGVISAAEHHRTQGQIFPRAAHIQWLMGSPRHIVTWYPMVKLAAFSVTWYLARALFLGVECDPLKPEKFCQVFCFRLYGSWSNTQEFVFYFGRHILTCPWPPGC